MATKRKSRQTQEDNHLFVSIEKKKKIFGIFLTVFSLLILLSILSYSRYDQANLTFEFSDLFKVFSSNPEFVERAEDAHNWLGIFGAYISNFFINSTLGIFSIVFPAVLFLFGYTVVTENEFKPVVHFSNFLVIMGLILASFFGMLQNEFQLLTGVPELYGKVGAFFGTAIGRLLGGLGSIIFFITASFVALFTVFDIKIEQLLEIAKTWLGSFASEGEEKPVKEEKKKEKSKPSENVAKAKQIRIKKEIEKEKEIDEVFDSISAEPEIEQEEEIDEKETQIRIIRQEPTEEVIEAVPVIEEDVNVIDDAEPKAPKENEIIPAIDKDEEETLPNQWEEKIKYKELTLDLLNPPMDNESVPIDEEELKRNAELLKEKLLLFDIQIEDISVTPGPVVTLYEIVPAPGVKISRIVSLENDIALALAARGIRIIAPIPGKSAIGVEIPNAQAQMVSARTVVSKINESKAELPLALGKTISGDIYMTDLAKMPHLLIAGSTGSGKSVGINMLITSLLYSKHPSDLKFAIVDPKKIELSFYQKLNKHYLAISPDIDEEIITNPQNALLLLKSVEFEMEKRYDKLAKAQVRNIVDYNKKVLDPKKKPPDTDSIKHYKMPYLVVIIDELADLMMTAGKEVEAPIARLAQLARAVGIHLVVATQRPSVNVITGVIKANFPARIAYQTATKIDSRTILDMKGAEQLLGRGDMLFLPGGLPKPVRIQNAFISTEEVEDITNFIYVQEGYSKRYFLPSLVEKQGPAGGGSLSDMDPMFEEAAKVIVRHQQGSVSLLQRRLKLGYSRAARIVDQLEEAGIVGPSEGSKAREVRIESEDELETLLRAL
ncbi:MAG: DNA translocase FtsK 4TM domain-containing protein [Rhodothermaceae bacterium]